MHSPRGSIHTSPCPALHHALAQGWVDSKLTTPFQDLFPVPVHKPSEQSLLSRNQPMQIDAQGHMTPSLHQWTQKYLTTFHCQQGLWNKCSPLPPKERHQWNVPCRHALFCQHNVFRIRKLNFLKQGLIFTFLPVLTTHYFLIPYAFMLPVWPSKALVSPTHTHTILFSLAFGSKGLGLWFALQHSIK